MIRRRQIRSPSRAALDAAVWYIAGVCGCAPDDDQPPPPPIVWEGEHLRFGTDEDLGSVCRGTLPYADGVVGYLAETFKVRAPQLDVYWVPTDIAQYCYYDPAIGCVNEGGVFSQYVLIQHEFVHALRRDDIGYLPLEEGLAEAYGDDWLPTREITGNELDLFPASDGEDYLDAASYPLAGFFASFIRARDGADALVELVHETERGESFTEARSAFDEVLGQSFEELVVERDSTYPLCDQTFSRDNGYDCAQQAHPGPASPGDEVVIDIPMDCARDDVLGPRRSERWKTIAIDIPVSGLYFVGADKVGGTAPGDLRFRRCGQSCFDDTTTQGFAFSWLGADATLTLDPVDAPRGFGDPSAFEAGCVAAGRYTVRASVAEDDEGSFQLRLGREEPHTCEFSR
jgi:hypothetical protein